MKTYDDTITEIRKSGEAEEEQLKFLLHPENLSPVVHLEQDNCSCPADSSLCETKL